MKFFVDTAEIDAIAELNDLGMVDGVQDLFGCQPHIDGMQHGTDHGHPEKALQVAVVVPGVSAVAVVVLVVASSWAGQQEHPLQQRQPQLEQLQTRPIFPLTI